MLTFLRSSSLGLLLKDGEERMTAGEWLCQRNASRDDQLLACGALIVAELRAAVLQETQFTCSAGIAHNKVLLTYELLFIVKQFAGERYIPRSKFFGLYDRIYSLGFIGLWVAVGTRCLQNSQAACTNLHSRQWCLHPTCLLCWPLYQSRKCKQPFDLIYNFLSFEQGNCWTHPIFLTLKLMVSSPDHDYSQRALGWRTSVMLRFIKS